MNPPSHAHQALELAQQRVARHDTAMAVDHAHTAWQAADEAGDVACRAQASTLLVQQLFALGRFTEALHQGERALQDWRQLQRHDDECEVLVMMALCLAEADVHDVAIALARTAHDLVQAHDLDARMPRVLALLGGPARRPARVGRRRVPAAAGPVTGAGPARHRHGGGRTQWPADAPGPCP